MVGRSGEQRLLERMLDSGRAEFMALYGRRRVGKTHLVRHFSRNRAGVYLEVVGTKNGSAAQQRRRFREAIEHALLEDVPLPDFRSWDDGLSYLCDLIERHTLRQPDEPVVIHLSATQIQLEKIVQSPNLTQAIVRDRRCS